MKDIVVRYLEEKLQWVEIDKWHRVETHCILSFLSEAPVHVRALTQLTDGVVSFQGDLEDSLQREDLLSID